MRILIINGPNLNLLGTREPRVYGDATLSDLERQWRSRAASVGASIKTLQTNHEGLIIDAIGEAIGRYDGLVINAGALTHYSYAIADAIAAVRIRTVEVHISNIYEREEWRHTSVIEPVSELSIVGRGTDGYLHAIDHLAVAGTHPASSVQYADHPQAVLDLRTPPAPGPHPTILLIHGGFWRSIWHRDLMDPMAAGLTDAGWATANVEYATGPGSYPASVDNLRSALQWVVDNAGSHDLDPGRIIAVGHSAGGYLALRLAHESDVLAGALGLAAVSDLAAIAASRPDDDPVAAFLGSTLDESPRLWNQAELKGSSRVPVHLIHGLIDDAVPSQLTEAYAAREGSPVATTLIDGCGHMELIDPRSGSWTAVLSALETLSS